MLEMRGVMDYSERIERMRGKGYQSDDEDYEIDEEFAVRISGLLNHPEIDNHCMVDAYYYDFAVIPRLIQEKLQLWRDAYLIFGITTKGEMISKWVDRWDLDSSDPIVDGKVIHSDKSQSNMILPEIRQSFDSILLSKPSPDFIRSFQSE
jgi:hypothetical protein